MVAKTFVLALAQDSRGCRFCGKRGDLPKMRLLHTSTTLSSSTWATVFGYLGV
jgi:hypothetical protein